MITPELIVILGGCALLHFVISVWRAMTYWESRGVKHLKPWPIFGNLATCLRMEKHISQYYDEIYKSFPEERMVGMYEFMTPSLIVKDPELVEQVLIRDFSSYQDHGPWLLDSGSILWESVFAATGNKWRALRNKLVTAFTTSKMKDIFPEIAAACQVLVDQPRTLDKQVFTEFAVKSFMHSMFGTKILPQGEQELIDNCQKIFGVSKGTLLRFYGLTYFRKMSEFLGIKFMYQELDDYFRSLMTTLLNQRETVGVLRNDYTQVVVDIRKMEKMNVFNRSNNKTEETFDVTNEIAVSQAFMFFFAGLDTTTLTMLYLAFELSLAKDCQEKARQEVRSVLKKFGGYSWEAVREMKYLDQCIQETLRLHPSLPYTVRICDKDTLINGVKIKKGTRIVVPIHSIQMDSSLHRNPEKFDPLRFDQQNPPKKFSHLPFSDGPRVCLGKRFSIMEIALLFAHLLDNFELSLSPETKLPVQYEPKVFLHTPSLQNPIKVLLTKIKP